MAEKTNFGQIRIFYPKLKKLTLLLKNSILSSCKGDSFLLSLHFFNLFFTIFFFFNCFCFLNKFIVIFLKNAVRYLSTFYRVQRYEIKIIYTHLETFSSAKIWSIFEHVVCIRVKRPVWTFTRFLKSELAFRKLTFLENYLEVFRQKFF